MLLSNGQRVSFQAAILFWQLISSFGEMLQQLPSSDATTESITAQRRLLLRGFIPTQPLVMPSSTSLDLDSNDYALSPEEYETTLPSTTTEFYDSVNITFAWDSTNYTSVSYQRSVCLQRCKNGNPVNIVNAHLACRSVECMPCSCERPACELYNLCCPDINEPYIPPPGLSGGLYTVGPHTPLEPFSPTPPHPAEAGNRSEDVGAEEMHFGCDISSGYNGFIYIRSCPSRFQNEIVARLCEQDLPSDEISADTITHVADKATGAVYRNKFCAECNGVTEFASFNLEIRCRHYMKLYAATEPSQLLSMIVAQPETCAIKQKWPAGAALAPCILDVFQ
ncbi:hypothetical protein Btru_025088 [Bulinus truncatus]|nr:hypothetical protein Btru_025088 [Bulinus truncatus]